jgi:hypothetical protein
MIQKCVLITTSGCTNALSGTVRETVISFLASFIGSVLAILVALWIEKKRLPSLEIMAIDEANDTIERKAGNSLSKGRWRFLRVAVRSSPFAKPFHWIPKQTAIRCNTTIVFSSKGSKDPLFSMTGRWASTAEMVFLPEESVIRKVLNPDPVSIPANKREILDIITKYEKDSEAYAWNNEAYLKENDWRTSRCKLDIGEYVVNITVHTENAGSFFRNCRLVVGKTIEETALVNLGKTERIE